MTEPATSATPPVPPGRHDQQTPLAQQTQQARPNRPVGQGPEQTISVWAPHAQRMVHLVADGVRIPMRREADGWWQAPEPVRAGADYGFSLDGGDVRPDPRSLQQPDGPDGLSRVVDLTAHTWTDQTWRGRGLPGAVIYELHIGTFTPAGTFDAAIERLDHLDELGVTHVEVLPVAGVPGRRNWGYDGVNWYTTTENYGGPHAFQRFVDACHSRGLAVILDVVYNHLGPSGNYLPEFGSYFNPAKNTPWGPAINLDGPGSDEVRGYVLDNAALWVRDFHVDGLRLDAVHALADESAIPILEELAATLDDLAAELGREIVTIAESDRNDPTTVTPRRRTQVRQPSGRADATASPNLPIETNLPIAPGGTVGMGLTGQWADDIHHALHVLLTGETQGYYADFADPDALRKTLNTPYFHDGTYSSFRGRRHGRPVGELPGWRFVASLQTHDQIGNRAAGDRLSHLVPIGRLACGAALLLTSPYTPMVFMGEEWGAQTPWQFFTDHTDLTVAEATSRGRAEEFAAHGWGQHVPDPQAESTFTNSTLNWDEFTDPNSDAALLLEWYRTLLRLRRTHEPLRDATLAATPVERGADADAGHIIVHRGPLRVAVNLSTRDLTVVGDTIASWHTARVQDGQVTLPPDSVAVVRVPTPDVRTHAPAPESAAEETG